MGGISSHQPPLSANPFSTKTNCRRLMAVNSLLAKITLPEDIHHPDQTSFCREKKYFGGKKYTPKVLSAVKLTCLNRQKRGLVYTKKLVFKGKKKENTYTPKNLQGGCWGPFRAVLVHRFWPHNAKFPVGVTDLKSKGIFGTLVIFTVAFFKFWRLCLVSILVGIVSRSPKAGHPKAGRSDFRNQRFETDTGKMRKMRKVPLTPEKQGSEEIPQSKNAENAEKCGKCRPENAENAENADDWL